MTLNSASFVIAAMLLGCAPAPRTVDSCERFGSSTASASPGGSIPLSGKPPPTLNQSLSDGASAETSSAYEYLLVTSDVALGVQCGPELGATSVWRALSVLVQDRRAAMLWDLSARAGAPESRAAAVIGLAKLRTISFADGRDLGCPKLPPEEGAACDLAQGVTCPYSLTTHQGSAYQDLHLCSNDPERRWTLLQERCGELCTGGGRHVLDLDDADCTSRPVESCELAGAVLAHAPSGRTLLSFALSQLIDACAPGTADFGVTLELARGCPTRFSTNHEFSEGALACIRESLEGTRCACGELLPCIDYSEYSL